MTGTVSFSALQRAEIAEIQYVDNLIKLLYSFSALQRAEIAEITNVQANAPSLLFVLVLFNEPKLLKSRLSKERYWYVVVSVLFNEPKLLKC